MEKLILSFLFTPAPPILLLLSSLSLSLSLSFPSPSHPSDEKEHTTSFPRNISAASLGSLMVHHHSNNHIAIPEPSATDPLMTTMDTDTRLDMEKSEVPPRGEEMMP